ncbi:Cof-type HAD-IIB family hydrolase [Candidatus Weimeria sp. HCP3S3_B5]|uniref:Cof-type HAD-IIB family hydrolase n=1 Tax=Candidatus Weimeria sp. HCP3S3_B5 TaxID=3438871 RepID=UPI003F8A2137
MTRKAVFFDIDGTLWDLNNQIPDSTVRAIHELQRKGHLAFINTGRTRAFVRRRNLLDIGFDGICCGCGTMLEIGGEALYYHRISDDLVIHTVETVRKYHFKPVLEGRYNLYLDDQDFADDFFGMKLKDELGDDLLSIKDNWGNWEISKLSCATPAPLADVDSCRKELGKYYQFMAHNSEVCELVPAGHTKASIIDKVCEKFGIDISDTVAIGDGVNDIDMLSHAGVGVAMGNGSEEAKAASDMVTSPIGQDGVFNALSRLGLILDK